MTAAEFNDICDDKNMWNVRLDWENIPTQEQRNQGQLSLFNMSHNL